MESRVDEDTCCSVLAIGYGAFVVAILAAELWGWMPASVRVYMTFICSPLGV